MMDCIARVCCCFCPPRPQEGPKMPLNHKKPPSPSISSIEVIRDQSLLSPTMFSPGARIDNYSFDALPKDERLT